MTTQEEKIQQFIDGDYYPDGCSWKQNELRAAFEMVQNLDNWKMPTREIEVNDRGEAEKIRYAVIHFTGGSPNIIPVYCYSQQKWIYKVTKTEGYYFHIGA